MKKITLKLTNYVIKGVADLTAWGGVNGSIQMENFTVKRLKDIKENLNDNGFGVQSINGGVCDIYRNYEGTLKYARTLIIGKVSEDTLNCQFC